MAPLPAVCRLAHVEGRFVTKRCSRRVACSKVAPRATLRLPLPKGAGRLREEPRGRGLSRSSGGAGSRHEFRNLNPVKEMRAGISRMISYTIIRISQLVGRALIAKVI